MKHFIFALAFFTVACSSDTPSNGPVASDSQVVAVKTLSSTGSATFDFDQPSLALVLPNELLEISGLTVLPEGHLGTVQDEEGTVYVLNRKSGTVEARLPFGEAGDYEGIEWAGEKGYVLRSDGTVIELTGSSENLRASATFQTSLKRKNDTEGLGYDHARGLLLIAAKEDPGSGLDKDQRAIYTFDPAAGELSSEPAYVIDTKEVENQLPGGKSFKPSGVAVHPNGEIYVLSAASRSIAVLAPDGRLKSVQSLQKDMFEQPEGIAFHPDGTLYISSEGDKSPPMLYEFRSDDAD